MLCNERTQLLQEYAQAIGLWFGTLRALHHSIGILAQTDYELCLATALQARDECRTRKQILRDHRVWHGC